MTLESDEAATNNSEDKSTAPQADNHPPEIDPKLQIKDEEEVNDENTQPITTITIPPTHAECRICLETHTIANLVQPCHCTGTVAYAHLTCLKTWVSERGNLQCELCSSPYNPTIETELKSSAEEALRRREDRRQRAEAAARIVASMPDEDDDDARWSTQKKVCRVLCILFSLGALVCLLIVLGMEAGDSVWAAVILRIVAFTLPLFLVFKATCACVEMRRYAIRMRDARDNGLPV